MTSNGPLSVALFLACALFMASVSSATAQLRNVDTSQLTAADGTVFEVTNAVVRVAEVRATTAEVGKTIDLAIVRLRLVGATASRSAHVVLAGGPGDSGVDQILELARQGGKRIASLMDGDLIGIDQRGSGRSVPNLSSSALFALPLDQPGSLETWLPIIERVSSAEAARLRASGIGLEAYNTRESADDVAEVCRMLGYERVILWGRSYGTHLALATVARHKELIERLVLVSPEGLDHTWKLPSQVDTVLARLESRGAGELVASLAIVLGRLRREPVAVTVPHPQHGSPTRIVLGAFDVQWIIAQALGDPRLLTTLPSAVREMLAGDFTRIAQIAILRRQRTGVQSAMKMMMDLSSGAGEARRARIAREASGALLGNAINFPAIHLSAAWGATDLGDTFRQPVTSDVPALLLVGDLDPRTPIENAREIAATLTRATVVVLENAAHQFDLFGNPSIRELLSLFLRDRPMGTERVTLPALVFR